MTARRKSSLITFQLSIRQLISFIHTLTLNGVFITLTGEHQEQYSNDFKDMICSIELHEKNLTKFMIYKQRVFPIKIMFLPERRLN